MGKKQDPRTVQTKALIKQTLLDMLKETAFDKITVSELCKIAGINRGTFYLHYCDLWAVLEELEEEALREEPSDEPYQCSLSAEHYECPYGICDKIHTHPEYGVIFFDDSLTSHVLAINKKIYRNGSKNWEASRDLIGGFIQSGLKRYMK